MGYVYQIINKINDKKYIGKTKLDIYIRFKQHLQHARLNDSNGILYKAIRKYKIENFIIISLYQSDDEYELGIMESYYIKIHRTITPYGYNMSMGGEGCNPIKSTKESRNRVSKSIQGRSNKTGKLIPYVGVYNIKDAKVNKYKSVITKNKITYHLGCYPSMELAAEAYNKKAVELYGNNAKLNNFAFN